MEKIIPRKETKTFNLKVLNKDKFSMTSVLNKQRFEQLDRLLRSNDLYTLATKTRPPPISTLSNEFGYVPSMVKCINGVNKTISADSIANYDYDLTRLETVMHIAFDKALHHQSQGFVDHDPVRMYSDMHTYFHGQDSHGIKAARLAQDKFKINPSVSLRADITLFEEVIRNVEFAAEGVILEKIKLSIVDEKFNQDTRIGVRERLVHSQVNHLSYTETLEELKNVPNASVTPASNHRMMAFTPKTEICNNHAKGRCTFGDRCKYIHDGQPSSKPVPMKAIQDAAPPPPSRKPPAPAGAPPKHKAVPPTYIEERHRSFMGQPKGLLSPTNPLGYSRKQYVVLKHLQVQ
jgi:Zinc finger C-x8-C-x5-C-x3-H type (and similar)